MHNFELKLYTADFIINCDLYYFSLDNFFCVIYPFSLSLLQSGFLFLVQDDKASL